MAHGALSTADWIGTVDRLGGPELLAAEARETGAFLRPREVKTAVDLLRLVLGYCLGHVGLRLTAAWSEGIGLASLSNVALLGRLRNCVPWLEKIVARLLAEAAQAEAARRADAGDHGHQTRQVCAREQPAMAHSCRLQLAFGAVQCVRDHR